MLITTTNTKGMTMNAITVTTAAGIRTLNAEAVAIFTEWKEGCRDSISTDHPIVRHSPSPLPWAHPGTMVKCKTWGEWNDHLGQPPSPDHYFEGV